MKHCDYHLVVEVAEKYRPWRYLCIRCGEILEQARRRSDTPVESGKDLAAVIRSGGFGK